MNNNKSQTFKFNKVDADNLPFQCLGVDIKEKGPVGFYKNNDDAYNGVIFKDNNGNLTYFDVTHNAVYPFNDVIWGHDTFIFQPQMTSLKIVAQ